VRAPRGFKPSGELLWAALCEKPPTFGKPQRKSGRKLSGIKYERKAHEHFQAIYGDFYLASPWLMFRERTSSQVRYAQPDALLFDFDLGRITIVEMKYQHVEMAWWQMHKLYQPLVKHIFGEQWIIHYVEVVRWYDPKIPFPGKVKLCKTLDEAPCLDTGVHIWRP
jgi:hypothetical protein